MTHLSSADAVKTMPGRELLALLSGYADSAAGLIRGSQEATIAAGFLKEWDALRAAEHHAIRALAAIAGALLTHFRDETSKNSKWQPDALFLALVKAARRELILQIDSLVPTPPKEGASDDAA
jgi:hypothetical protein